jgi:hypothetical protein
VATPEAIPGRSVVKRHAFSQALPLLFVVAEDHGGAALADAPAEKVAPVAFSEAAGVAVETPLADKVALAGSVPSGLPVALGAAEAVALSPALGVAPVVFTVGAALAESAPDALA